MLPLKRLQRALSRCPLWLITAMILACGGAESQDSTPAKPPVQETPSEAKPTPQSTTPTTGVPLIEKGAQRVPTSETIAGPARYPNDGPECPGCTETGTWVDDTGRTHRTWTSPTPGDTIQKSMLKQLKSQGWEIRSNLQQSGQFALDATKNPRRIAILIASDEKTKENLVSAIITP
jgi:hypothetical protein